MTINNVDDRETPPPAPGPRGPLRLGGSVGRCIGARLGGFWDEPGASR